LQNRSLGLKDGINTFEEVISLVENSEFVQDIVIILYCLAFLNSCFQLTKISLIGYKKAAMNIALRIKRLGQGYSLLFLGLTYKI
jgi:hypothetical protein